MNPRTGLQPAPIPVQVGLVLDKIWTGFLQSKSCPKVVQVQRVAEAMLLSLKAAIHGLYDISINVGFLDCGSVVHQSNVSTGYQGKPFSGGAK
jgi:hypothetical protein